MRTGVAVVAAWFLISPALAQVPGQTGNNNPINVNPIITNSANPTTTSGSNSSATGGAGGAGGAGGSANPNAMARGGTSNANPNASSGASSGSSSVAVTTGSQNTIYPQHQTVMTVPMVYTPSISTGNVCALGASGGASWLGAGFAFGASWESMQCERRQTAALLWNMNTPESRAASKEILCNSPEIRAAYAATGSPCMADVMTKVAGIAPNAATTPTTIAPTLPTATSVAFNAAQYGRASDCLTAAQAAGAALSLCAGKR